MPCRNDEGRPATLRVGIVDYLNSWPLAWSFLERQAGADVEAHFLSPAAVADSLAQNRIDVGLVPSIEVQRIPGVSVVRGLCVAATREVRSVLLLSRVPADRIQRLALDQNSRTSAALVRIVLRERFGVDPLCSTSTPDLESMLARADAALIIGDPALTVDRTGLEVFDLAQEWRRLTHRPFVFAVWAVRQGVELGDRVKIFRHSLERGMAAIDRLIDKAEVELSLPGTVVRRYLTECLSFELGAEEQEGLDRFFAKALEHGFLAELRSTPRIG